ncbi:MAG: hypothetical protein N3D75_03995 [Candidatus Aenigmarchaeota archaeon]|nr:hypothetical protein [Candidatus Aenigmarchaeota archaeon]
MARKRIKQVLAKRIVFLILMGAITALLGAAIAGKAEISANVSQADFAIMIIVSLIMFFITGMTWLYTAILIKDLEEC